MRDLPKTSRPRAIHPPHQPVAMQGRSPMVALTKGGSCRPGIGDQGVTRQSIFKTAAPSEARPAAPPPGRGRNHDLQPLDHIYPLSGVRPMTTEPSNLLPFMTVNYVANYLQVAPRTVRRLIKSADIVAHRVRGQLRITDKDLTTYTRTCREA